MTIRPGVTIVINRTKALADSIAMLVGSRVLVGFPAEAQAPRDDADGLNNASLGYIHDQGAPEANIPARPFLAAGIQRNQKAITSWLEAAARAALKGNAGVMGANLTGAGLTAVSAVRGTIAAGIPPPLAPATIAKRRRRSKGSKYRRKATSAADVTPLLDTGAMSAAVTYVLERGGKRKGG